jgi:hypothetical protein
MPMAGWNGNAMCDGIRAEERVLYLMKEGKSDTHAREQVMREFPAQFGGGGGFAPAGGCGQMYNPNAMCDGKRAEERVEWLQQNEGMSMHAARERVMREFPGQFGGGGFAPAMGVPAMGGGYGGGGHHGHHGGGVWNPNAMCDGSRAEERAKWLHENKGMSMHHAQKQVMEEFPGSFPGGAAGIGAAIGAAIAGGMATAMGHQWNPNAMCDGKRAQERADWLHQHEGLSHHAAKERVMNEFPNEFRGHHGGHHGGHGKSWNPNAMCDGSRAEERAVWLQQNEGMTTHAARERVMREFSNMF